MKCYLYIDAKGDVRPVSPESVASESKKCSHNMVLLPRLDIDVKIVELPVIRRDIRPLLELKIAALYPGNPEQTVFDFSMLRRSRETPNREGITPNRDRLAPNRDRAILFIARRSSIEQIRSKVKNPSFFLPTILVQRFLKKSGFRTAVCTFWWIGWYEILVFDRGEMVTDKVFEGSDSPMKLSANLRDVVPDEYREAPHFIFCSEQDRTLFSDSHSTIRPLPDRIMTVERVFRESGRVKDGLFAHPRSVFRGYRGIAVAAILLTVSVILSFLLDRRLQIAEEAHLKLQAQAQRVVAVKTLLQRHDNLTAEYEELAKHRPVDAFILLQELARTCGKEPEVQQLVLDEARRIQLDGRSQEPFSLMARLEESTRFSSLKLSRIVKDEKRAKERFNLTGVYRDR